MLGARASGLQARLTCDAGPTNSAVALGILREILLVVVLGVVELRRGDDFGRDRAVAGRIQLLLIGVARASAAARCRSS